MRTARLVGLSQDGRHLIVATDDGDEIAIVADDRLRAALRGDRPRLGQLEIEMDLALRPRDIQARIRSGQSVEDVARVAGVPVERIEPYAAPVLAEREYVAALAMTSSVRRRGETSGHRKLRAAVSERLLGRGVDPDSVHWDSARMDDGRWAVSAAYRSGEASRVAVFHFDLAGRFSVAGNDEARWVLNEPTPLKGPQPGRRPRAGADDDEEPTLDLSDEMALVRAVQEEPAPDAEVITLRGRNLVAAESGEASEPFVGGGQPDESAVGGGQQDEPAAGGEQPDQPAVGGERPESPGNADEPSVEPALERERDRLVGAEVGGLSVEGADPNSQLDVLASMLEDQRSQVGAHAAAGPSEAAAVPVPGNGGWEPAIVMNYPLGADTLEPEEDPCPEVREERSEEEAELETELHPDAAPGGPSPSGTEGASAPDNPPSPEAAPGVDDPSQAGNSEVSPDGLDPGATPPFGPPADSASAEPASAADSAVNAPAKPTRRKRAAVPSWDEIMFGGSAAKRDPGQ